MLRVIRQLCVFSSFISEIQSSPAAPGYRQSRHKRKPATQKRVLLQADLERSSVFMDSSVSESGISCGSSLPSLLCFIRFDEAQKMHSA
jgi:hypothetical protein